MNKQTYFLGLAVVTTVINLILWIWFVRVFFDMHPFERYLYFASNFIFTCVSGSYVTTIIDKKL